MNRFLWMVRREVWEHKAIWIAPLVVIGCVILLVLTNHVHFGPLELDDGPFPVLTPEQKVSSLNPPATP